MPENISKEQRSRNMSAIRSQSKLENRISKALWRDGIRFRKNNKSLFGKPDISIKKYKVVIFIDSCFWHSCEIHGNRPKSNQEYWDKKLAKNIKRDQEVTDYYTRKGWRVKRIWEHEVNDDFTGVIKEIKSFIKEAKMLML